jgi:hypothetical protein
MGINACGSTQNISGINNQLNMVEMKQEACL